MATIASAYSIAFHNIFSYLVHTFLEATTVTGITYCYEYFVILATRAGAYKLLFEGIQILYLVQMFFEVFVISFIFCCYGYNVTVATEAMYL